jgi:hypothetical protein
VSLDVTRVSRSSSPGLKRFPGQVSLVVVSDPTLLHALGAGWWLGPPEEKRTLDDMPRLQLPVILEDLAVKVWDEEDSDQERNTSTHTEDGSRELPIFQVDPC